jgi:hypothetical protein
VFINYNLGDQIKKNEIGEARGTFRGEERCIQSLVGKPEEKRPLGRHGEGGRIILKRTLKK